MFLMLSIAAVRSFGRFYLCLIGIVFLGAAAHADSLTWDNEGANNHWNNGINWSPDKVPTSGDDLTIGALDVVAVPGSIGVGRNLNNSGTVNDDGAILLSGALTNSGTIVVRSDDSAPTAGASLSLAGTSALEGTGEILLRRSPETGVAPATLASTGGSPVTQAAEHTIRGEGTISANLINNGLIQAEDLDINPVALLVLDGPLQNNHMVRTSATAGIRIESGIMQSASGHLVADDGTIEVRVASIAGGSLDAENGGSYLVSLDSTVTDLTNNAPVNVITGMTGIDLNVTGAITNNGVITINSDNMNGAVTIQFIGSQILGGTGQIVLNRPDLGLSGLIGASLTTSAGAMLTQNASHTIRGEGRIAAALINDGLVEATDANSDGSGLLLVTNTSNGSANAVNNNIFRAATNSMIDLAGRLDQSSAGRLIAADGGVVQFRVATLVGGSVQTEGSGVARVPISSTFEDVTNDGQIDIPGGGSQTLLNLRGNSLTNNGVITVNSTATGVARILALENLSLDGNGEIVLAEAGGGSQFGLVSGASVTQSSGHTICGRGQINGSGLLFVNNGTLEGTSPAEPLEINSRLGGTGLLKNVRIDGTHAPGESTAIVPLEGAYTINSFGGRLEIEIGGTTPGDDYDQLFSGDLTNVITIGTDLTTLAVSMINGFVPAAGDMFTIITTAGTVNGQFNAQNLPSLAGGNSLTWAVHYNASDVTLEVLTSIGLPGDYNQNGTVDAADYAVWRNNEGTTNSLPNDPLGGTIGARQYNQWRSHFGQTAGSGSNVIATAIVAEPVSSILLLIATVGGCIWRRRWEECPPARLCDGPTVCGLVNHGSMHIAKLEGDLAMLAVGA